MVSGWLVNAAHSLDENAHSQDERGTLHNGIEIMTEEKEGEQKGDGPGKSGDDDDDSFVPPPTPLAPQFYTKKSGSSSDNGSKSPASDASLTTMAQTLITGGPVGD